MQLVPPDICEAFFAGCCLDKNCTLRHETELPAPEPTPPPPQPQPAAAVQTEPPSDSMQGINVPTQVTSRPNDAVSLPSSQGKVTASHSNTNGLTTSVTSPATSPPVESGGAHAAVQPRKVCKTFVENGYCDNGECTLERPEDDEDEDAYMDELVDCTTMELPQPESVAAPAENQGSTDNSVQGETLPDSTKCSPNGPNNSELTEIGSENPPPSEPDRSSAGCTDLDDVFKIDLDELPSEAEDDFLPSKKCAPPSPTPISTSPKNSKSEINVSAPSNPDEPPNTNLPAADVKKSPPSPSPINPTPEPIVIKTKHAARHPAQRANDDAIQANALEIARQNSLLEAAAQRKRSEAASAAAATNTGGQGSGDDSTNTPQPVAPISGNSNHHNRSSDVEHGQDMEIGNNNRIDINAIIPPSQAVGVTNNGIYNQSRGGGPTNRHNGGAWGSRSRENRNRSGHGRARAPMPATRNLNLPVPKKEIVAQVTNKFRCKVCAVDCGSETNWDSHVGSKKHIRKVNQAKLNEDNELLQNSYRTQTSTNRNPTAVNWNNAAGNNNNTQPAEAAEDSNNANGNVNGNNASSNVNGNNNNNSLPSYLANYQQSTGNNADEDEDEDEDEDMPQYSNNSGHGNASKHNINNNADEDEDEPKYSNNSGDGYASKDNINNDNASSDGKDLSEDEDDDEDDIPRPSDLVSPVTSPVKPVVSPTTVSLAPSVRVESSTQTSLATPAEVTIPAVNTAPSTRIQVAASEPQEKSPPPSVRVQSSRPPPPPIRVQSSRPPLFYNNGPVATKAGKEGDERSNNIEDPLGPQKPSTADNDMNMSVDLDPEKLPATGTMPDVVSPRSVSDQGTSPSPSDGKSSPPKAATTNPQPIIPNSDVVDAAVSTIKRSNAETQNKKHATTILRSKPIFDATNTRNPSQPATDVTQRFVGEDSIVKPSHVSRKGSRFSNVHQEQKDQEMNDIDSSNANVPMDTSNDDFGIQINATGHAAERVPTVSDIEDGELIEDVFSGFRQPLGSMTHASPHLYEAPEANEAPTIGSMNALREIFMHGDRANQLAFKMFQELLISPTIGVGMQHLKPFMRTLEKVPQYLNEKGKPFLYWQHIHPRLINQTPTIEQELQYSTLDREEETAVEVVVDNIGYLAHSSGTNDLSCSFMNDGKGPAMPVRGRFPNSKANQGVDDIQQDSLYHFISKR